MKKTSKYLSDTKIELTITVSKEELSDAKQVALVRLARDVKVEGFRKGKAPVAAVEKQVDAATLENEVLNNALNKAVAAAFLEEDLRVIDRPSVEVKKYVSGDTLEFTATAEIVPKITLGNYKKLKASKAKQTKLEVSDKEIDDVIDRLRENIAEKKAVKRAAKTGDEVIIDFVGKRDGVAFDGGTGNDYALKLGSNTFIPGFEDGIVGKKPGETFDLKLKFPDDYHAVDLKGAEVVFTTALKTVNEVGLPEVNDDLAKKVGPFKTVDEMREDIKTELTSRKAHQAKEALKDSLVEELIEASKVPVPEMLVDDQAQSIEQDMQQNLMYQGLALEQYLVSQGFTDETEWREKEVRPTATKRVKAALVLDELAKQEKIEASDEEIDRHVELYKQQYGNNPETLKRFERPEVRREIAHRLVTEKAVERLLELNTAS